VSGFSAEWLALREPHDARARSAPVLDAVAAHVAQRGSIGVVDLACGTGATMRAISARLAPRQDWRLVDNDLGLLARADAGARKRGINVTAVPIDLARDLEAALDGAIDLVTTSALLDLVSEDWLERLVVEAAARRLPVYAALSYDGKVLLDPPDPCDAAIVAAVNRHQAGDKGFGPALGPAAAAAAIARFGRTGYAVVSGQSDWVIAAPDVEFQTELLAGWAVAARETGDLSSADVAAWVSARHDLIGRTSVRVGHVDFFAWPTGTR
jgi:methyltransferase family protein